jgi:pimeloyl-ACP methyl ester carboxylesterase
MALMASSFLGPDLLDRFDIIGFDPRGINFSKQVKCFASNAAQSKAMAGINVAFPDTAAQEKAYIASSIAVGKGCSTTGQSLSASMSTAEVARDMDVLRRAVGDKKLSYLGFSYGTYLGQVYANIYPDRVRAVAIDGVLDPKAWAGTKATANIPQTTRMKSGEGATKALQEILRRCDSAGAVKCRLAPGGAAANYDLVARRLRKAPIVFVDPFAGTFRFTYADLVANSLGAMYGPFGYMDISENVADMLIATDPATAGAPPAAAKAATARRVSAVKALSKSVKAQQARSARPAFDFPYDNSFDGFSAVACTDGGNPTTASQWPAAADAADLKAKYFGRLWTWSSSQCARSTWTAKDEDAYHGPFTKRTVAPVLVVGTKWDPATNYAGAVKAASLLPNSRLLSNDNWGHTSYGSSDCATGAIERYLIKLALPVKGKLCTGDIQPFVEDLNAPPPPALARLAKGLVAPAPVKAAGRALPPVVAPFINHKR